MRRDDPIAGAGRRHSLSVALFGGTAPYLGTWFKSQGWGEAFPIYISALCLISLLVYVFAVKETAHEPLP